MFIETIKPYKSHKTLSPMPRQWDLNQELCSRISELAIYPVFTETSCLIWTSGGGTHYTCFASLCVHPQTLPYQQVSARHREWKWVVQVYDGAGTKKWNTLVFRCTPLSGEAHAQGSSRPHKVMSHNVPWTAFNNFLRKAWDAKGSWAAMKRWPLMGVRDWYSALLTEMLVWGEL